MNRAGRLPGDQAEIVFTDVFTEQLGRLDTRRKRSSSMWSACARPPGGSTRCTLRSAGWNTLAVLGGHHRVVYKASARPEPG